MSLTTLASSLDDASADDDSATTTTTLDEEEVALSVKRLHSRHRRNIAPGTRWDWLIGWETVSEVIEIQVRYKIVYEATNQCDQIGRFLKVLGGKFYYNHSLNIC